MATTSRFQQRAGQQGLRQCVLDFVLRYGAILVCAGAQFVTVPERGLPPNVDHRMMERARGWVIVLSDDWDLITCYRRRDALRYVRGRMKSRRTARAQ